MDRDDQGVDCSRSLRRKEDVRGEYVVRSSQKGHCPLPFIGKKEPVDRGCFCLVDSMVLLHLLDACREVFHLP
jgi:hypothetical protein